MSDEEVEEGMWAVALVWKAPELVEKILLFLDLVSTKQLARVHKLTRKVLGKAFVWNQLIRRVLPMKDVIFEDYAAEKTKARLLAEILILTEDTDKSQLALDLFHTLDNRIRSQGWFEVEVSCICLQNHRMSIWVACLMSEVQTRGIQLLNVERVSAWCDLKGFALRDLSWLVAGLPAGGDSETFCGETVRFQPG